MMQNTCVYPLLEIVRKIEHETEHEEYHQRKGY